MFFATEALGVNLVLILRAGRARGKPRVLRRHLEAADHRAVARRLSELGDDLLARQLRRRHLLRRELLQDGLLLTGSRGIGARIGRRTIVLRQLRVALRRSLTRHCQDLRGQQVQDDAILVGGPHAPVEAQEGSTGGFFAAEAEGAVDKPRHKPLEAHRHLHELTPQAGHDAVDHGRGHQGLAHAGVTPLGAVAKQVLDGHREVVVRVHQARVRRHNAVTVRVGVVARGQVVLGTVIHQ